MIGACERTMELERATQWWQVTDEYARRYKFLPLFAFCRATYAGVLALARAMRGSDLEGYREELLRMMETSSTLAGETHQAIARQ